MDTVKPLSDALLDPAPYLNEMSLTDYLEIRYPTVPHTPSETPKPGVFVAAFSAMEYNHAVAVLNSDIRISLENPYPDHSRFEPKKGDKKGKGVGGIAKSSFFSTSKKGKSLVCSVGDEPQ